MSVTGGYQFFKMCDILQNSTPGQYDGQYPLDHKGRYHTCQMSLFAQQGQAAVTQMCETVGNLEDVSDCLCDYKMIDTSKCFAVWLFRSYAL